MALTAPAAQITRFAAVGILSTLIYAGVAFGLSFLMPATVASVSAYGVAAIWSYTGHKYLTFASDGEHRFEAPRFVVVTLTGIAVAWVLPKILVDGYALPPILPIVATCLLIPAVNYVVLNRWVFGSQSDRP